MNELARTAVGHRRRDELVDAVLETIRSGWWSMPNAHLVDGTGSPAPSLNVFGDAEKRVAGQG